MRYLISTLCAVCLLTAADLPHAFADVFDDDAPRAKKTTRRDYQAQSVKVTRGDADSLSAKSKRWLSRLPPAHILFGIIGGLVGVIWTQGKNKRMPRWALLSGVSWLVLLVALARLVSRKMGIGGFY